MQEQTVEELKEQLNNRSMQDFEKRLTELENWKIACEKSKMEDIERNVRTELNIQMIFNQISAINDSIKTIKADISKGKEENTLSITGFLKKNFGYMIIAIYLILDKVAL